MAKQVGSRSNVKEFLRRWEKSAPRVDEEMQRLERYATQGMYEYRSEYVPELMRYDYGSAMIDLGCVGLRHAFTAQSGAFGGTCDWETAWRKAVAYMLVAQQLDFALHLRAHSDFERGSRPQQLQMLHLRACGFLAATAAALGWMEESKAVVTNTMRCWTLNLFNDGKADFCPRRAQWFILQLLASYFGVDLAKIPAHARGTAPYDWLLANAQSTDHDELARQIGIAADRHVEQSSFSEAKQADFDEYHSMQYPSELLALLRLRAITGRQSPEISHPLMQAPLGKLPEATAVFSDNLLHAVVMQSRVELGA
jgi:hypothetical protein